MTTENYVVVNQLSTIWIHNMDAYRNSISLITVDRHYDPYFKNLKGINGIYKILYKIALLKTKS